MVRKSSNSADVSGWVGWVYFAGLMLMLSGVFQSIAGLVALFKDEVYVVAEENLWLLDYTSWGWGHLLFGVFLIFAGAAVTSGKMWGRVVGIIFASLSLIANFGFIPVYPVWSILLVTIDILVLYALVVHGREAQDVLE
jgi:hypothetical protein